MYRLWFELVLKRLPAEGVHRAMFALLRLTMAIPGVGALWRRRNRVDDPVLRQRVFGVDVPAPFGLAAGFDKDGKGPNALLALGFGFVEVGTITGQPQPGNPKPRLFRLPVDRAIVNRMGFNNDGSAVAARRLARPRRGVVGINIGKTKLVPDDQAIADYVTSTERLAPLADYLVVNVSSPNTPGLRDLQAIDRLEPLLRAVRAACDRVSPQRHVPLLVKIAPDLADEDIDAVADLAAALPLDGVIATNTTIGRAGLQSEANDVAAAGPGGLSGAPLAERSLAVLERLYRRTGTAVPLVSVGGIGDADDAWQRIRAGATLVQGYTGFIYGGPGWARDVNRGLAARVKAAGLGSIKDAIGADVAPLPLWAEPPLNLRPDTDLDMSDRAVRDRLGTTQPPVGDHEK